MRRSRPFILLLLLGLVASLLLLGCEPRSAVAFTPEVDDTTYRRGKELQRQGRDQEALSAFLKVIDERGLDGAPESHLEAAIIYQQNIKDPIAAIFHYRRYRELRPNTQQAELAAQRIEAATRDFARTLPARPLDHTSVSVSADGGASSREILEKFDTLQKENIALKERLLQANAALLDASRPSNPPDNTPPSGIQLAPSEPPAVISSGLVPPTPRPLINTAEDLAVAPITPVYSDLVPARPTETGPLIRPPVASGRTHVVQRGENLQVISLRYYGTRSRFREIYTANRDVMPNEATLRVGMVLRIP
jgi:nucleoid-associated protein YgaU